MGGNVQMKVKIDDGLWVDIEKYNDPKFDTILDWSYELKKINEYYQ